MHNVLQWIFAAIITSILIGLAGVNITAKHFRKPETFIRSIEISVDEIQRENTPFKLTNNTIGTAEWIWQIFNAANDSLVLTAVEKNPTLVLPNGKYDVLVTAHGKNTLKRHFRRIINVLPPVFSESEADEVIDLSSFTRKDFFKDYRNEIRPGYKILIKGSITGRVKFTGLRGTKENPVHIINSGQVIITAGIESSPYPFLWSTGNQYILMDGKADPKINYGFVIKNHPSKSGQAFFIGGEFNRGFEVCGLNIIGRQGFAQGASGIQLQATYSPLCNASNWSFEYFSAHHNKIEEATNEGFYIGYFTDRRDSIAARPYRLGEVLIYRNEIINSGRDGIQIASADVFEVHDNYIDSSGKDGKRSHNSAFSWNDGNFKGWCYRNTFKNSAQAFAIFFGRTGREAYVYSNLLIQGAYPKTAKTPTYNYAVADNETNPVSLYIFNNTMTSSNLGLRIKYKNVTGKSIPILFAGNAMSLGAIIPKYYPDLDIGKNHADSATWIVKNEWRLDSLNQTLWNENFKPATKDSPLFKKDFDLKKLLPVLKGGYYDRDGYSFEFEPGISTFGCYSGYEFFIDNN